MNREIGLLIVTPLIIAVGQVLFKIAGERLLTSQGKIYQLAFDPIFIGAVSIYAMATFMWVYVLKTVPLAQAYSFMALTFVMVPVLATFFLGETITLKYVMGAGLIISGLLMTHL